LELREVTDLREDRACYSPSQGLLKRICLRVWVRLRIKLAQIRNPGLKIGIRPRIDFSRVQFNTWPGEIEIGDDCGVYGGIIMGRLKIGDRVNLMSPCRIGGGSSCLVTIGNDTWIAPNAYINPVTHAYKRRDKTISGQGVRIGDISIGEDCWIGANVVISPGVTVGNGAVIGANSVVTRDIPEYAIAVGSPAKVISYRE